MRWVWCDYVQQHNAEAVALTKLEQAKMPPIKAAYRRLRSPFMAAIAKLHRRFSAAFRLKQEAFDESRPTSRIRHDLHGDRGYRRL
jgi:hypothetical protein